LYGNEDGIGSRQHQSQITAITYSPQRVKQQMLMLWQLMKPRHNLVMLRHVIMTVGPLVSFLYLGDLEMAVLLMSKKKMNSPQ
jgi:hypothetical protein